jgi:hypothetical protein
MKTILKTATALLAISAMGGQASAAGMCAKPDEYSALKAAAVQQKLMVAALYCSDVGLYNRFVISYQKELQDSDATLLSYFQRTEGKGGAKDYHAYKTSLANGYSLESIHAMQRYCHAADVTFDAALDPSNSSLRNFLAVQSVPEAAAYPACGTMEANADTVSGGSSRDTNRH